MSHAQANKLGSVHRLQVSAVKGFALQNVQTVDITISGIAGNREFFLVDVDELVYSVPKDPIFLSWSSKYDPTNNRLSFSNAQGQHCEAPVRNHGPRRPFQLDERTVDGWWAPGPWDDLLSVLSGRWLRLVRCAEPGGGHDVHPVTLQSTASLAALGRETDGRSLDSRRFRLNLTLDVGTEPFVEDTWADRELYVGSCGLRLHSPVPRCLAIENRPRDGDRGLQVQRRIRHVRGPTPSPWAPGVLFGMYAEVTEPGQIKVGDEVRTP
ncbi:MOSC domain-containing protein [Jatrophihabitans sp. YIM 134969]